MTDASFSDKSTARSRVADSVRSNAQEVIKEDYAKARSLAFAAAKSRSWLYPIKGVLYFVTHRSLWKPFVSRLPQYFALYGTVLAGMFTVTYLPQLAILLFVNGPFAVFTTVILILNESATIVNGMARSFLVHDALLDVFDGTLLARNKGDIVKEGREVKPGSDPIAKLGKALKKPFQKFSPKAIIRYIMYLPLNFIPLVGTACFIFLQAKERSKGVHERYFQLKKWSNAQQADWLEKHKGPYTGFGFVATLLEMIPVANIFFTFTNTVGAALWAADIESMNTSMTNEDAPMVQGSAEGSQ